MKYLICIIALLAFKTNGADNHGHTPKFSQLGEGDITHYVGRDIHHHVSVGDLPSNIALFEETLPPKSIGAPPHTHSNEDEIFIVLNGQVHFLSGEKEVKAGPGTIASLPRGHIHGFWNPYDEPATLLVVAAPGHFEDFFRAVEKNMSEGGPKSPPQVGQIIAETAAKYGVIVDMSKLPPSGLALLGPPPKE
ncbi:cupin domain-containing protein [Aestuariibacter salexigens]|uniref:cupin domain-containing protein n=1 Tax=Aestuariibacter salexigens TaxID=226010 RepID=UPI0003FE5382|nr:cupin domain-containing protein [Aestuariibacter salexigens]